MPWECSASEEKASGTIRIDTKLKIINATYFSSSLPECVSFFKLNKPDLTVDLNTLL